MTKIRKNLPRTISIPGRRTTIDGINYLFVAPGVSGLFESKKTKIKEYEPEHILPSRKKMLKDLRTSNFAEA